MNKFRSAVLSGTPGARETPLMAQKRARLAVSGDGLDAVAVPRSEKRRTNQRDGDRHRLPAEQATVRYKKKLHKIELINLSGGGAMIGGKLKPKLWDRVDLVLGEYGEIESAVRWIRGDRIGLEFAHETRIDCPAETRDALLRDVISQSYPDVVPEAPAPPPQAPVEAKPYEHAKRRDIRHPLIWSALIHFDHETTIARIRNISESGALVETSGSFCEGSELMLDFGDAGSLFATVGWSRGDQLGLAFKTPFDISCLAQAKPEVAPQRWARPDYLRDETNDSSPWAAQWGRLTIEQVQERLAAGK
jgi:PilZ domain